MPLIKMKTFQWHTYRQEGVFESVVWCKTVAYETLRHWPAKHRDQTFEMLYDAAVRQGLRTDDAAAAPASSARLGNWKHVGEFGQL